MTKDELEKECMWLNGEVAKYIQAADKLAEALEFYAKPHSKTFAMGDLSGDYEFIARQALKDYERIV